MTVRQESPHNPGFTSRREKLIDLLAFARDEIQGRIDLDGCAHNGWFTTDDEHCWACAANQECAWLLHNDGVLPWGSRSDADLLRALRFALEVLDTQSRDREHNVQSCNCDVCGWLRSARYHLASHR